MTDNKKKQDRRSQKNRLRYNKTALSLLDVLICQETDNYKKEKLLEIRKEICMGLYMVTAIAEIKLMLLSALS